MSHTRGGMRGRERERAKICLQVYKGQNSAERMVWLHSRYIGVGSSDGHPTQCSVFVATGVHIQLHDLGRSECRQIGTLS